MTKIKKHIEIVSSSQTGLSSMSQKSRDSICAALSREFSDVRITLVNNLYDLEALVARKPDLVFLGMKYLPQNPSQGIRDTERIWIARYLYERAIVCTGSGSEAHELELDKTLAKQRALDHGLKTSQFQVVRQGEDVRSSDIHLEYPVFVKPTDRGGGVGIDAASVVQNFEQLQAKVHLISSELSSDALIETYLPGREFSVAILKTVHAHSPLAMPIELIANKNEQGVRILGGDVKSSNAERVVPVTDMLVKRKICTLALDVFDALEARDYGRIDIRMDSRGEPYFLEANLIPSLIAGYGSFPKACVINKGLGYEAMILKMVNLALERSVQMYQTETTSLGDSVYNLKPMIEAPLVA